MPTSQFQPFANGGGANVLSPAAWAALAARSSGFSSGPATSAQLNTAWRQASMIAAGWAQLCVDTTGADFLDDGSLVTVKTNFAAMLNTIVQTAIDASGSFGSGGIFGLILSNTPAFTTTRVTISVGQCRDSTNASNLVRAVALTKDLTAAWAVGNNNGGRDAGALANGQTWHMFLIYNPTTTIVDALFSQSPTAPTLPAGYTRFRRLGAVLLEAAATTIRQFIQTGDWFMLKVRSADFAAQANGGGVPYLRQITVPAGIKVEARLYFQDTGTANLTSYLSGIYDPDQGVPAAFGGATQWAQVRRTGIKDTSSADISYATTMVTQFTDTARQVYTFSSDPSDVIALGVVGWRDERGRFY